MKIEVRKDPYTITDGNGGTLQARVVEKTPPDKQAKTGARVLYRVRRGNLGRYGARVHTVTIPAFRKLVAAAE